MSEIRTEGAQVLTRDQVLERIEPLTHLKVREVDHGPRTRVIAQPEGVIFRPGGGGHTMELTEDGLNSMAKYIGLPAKLNEQLSPDTFGKAATELLDRKGRYSVLTEESRIVSFHKAGEYHNTNPNRVIDTIERELGADMIFSRVIFLDRGGVCIEASMANQQPVVRGDLVQAGAAITFSPLGTIQPLVQSFILRCYCTNGWLDYDAGGSFSFGYGEGDSIWQFFRKAVRKAARQVDGVLAQWRNMIETRLDPAERAQILEALMKDAGISNEIAEALRARALETPPDNMYDAMNLITYASSHLLDDPRRIRRAQKTASQFVREANPSRECPLCHHRH